MIINSSKILIVESEGLTLILLPTVGNHNFGMVPVFETEILDSHGGEMEGTREAAAFIDVHLDNLILLDDVNTRETG